MGTDDKVAAELERIAAAAAAAAGNAVTATQRRVLDRYVPSLVAAVKAVLELADSAKAQGTTLCDCKECARARGRGQRSIHRPQPYMWNLDPAKVREAITSALAGTGKEGGEDE